MRAMGTVRRTARGWRSDSKSAAVTMYTRSSATASTSQIWPRSSSRTKDVRSASRTVYPGGTSVPAITVSST